MRAQVRRTPRARGESRCFRLAVRESLVNCDTNSSSFLSGTWFDPPETRRARSNTSHNSAVSAGAKPVDRAMHALKRARAATPTQLVVSFE